MLDKPLVLPNIDRKPEVNNAKMDKAEREAAKHYDAANGVKPKESSRNVNGI